MDGHKWLPWALIGGAALVLYLYLQGGGGSSNATTGFATVSPGAAPDTSASDAARYSFLASGIGTLAQLESVITNDQFQLTALQNTNAAQVEAAKAQAAADTAAAKASTAGKHGLNLGPFSFTW